MHKTQFTPFHEGEKEAQRLAGTQGTANELSRAIKPGEVHADILPFLYSCQLSAVSTVDSSGNVWSSCFYAAEGLFTVDSSLSVVSLNIPLSNILPHEKSATVGPTLAYGLPVRIAKGDNISLLPFEPATRSRYRINGRVLRVSWGETKLNVLVEVATAIYNCPKYINRRAVEQEDTETSSSPSRFDVTRGKQLAEAERQIIQRADIFFMSTYAPAHGTDVNHRGGRPGFVRVIDDGHQVQLMWPEYRGNGMFQSTGNILLNPHIGMVFFDFAAENPSHLFLSGTAQVDWDDMHGFEAGDRVIILTVEEVVHVRPAASQPAAPFPRFKLIDFSPYNPKVKTEVQSTSSQEHHDFPFDISLVKIVSDSSVIKTFRFASPRKLGWLPGQFATFAFDPKLVLGTDTLQKDPIVRTWTISESPNSTRGDSSIEISVKRKEGGLVSTWLHSLTEKDVVTAKLLGIDGQFTLFSPINTKQLPEGTKLGWENPPAAMPPERVLFLSAGVGITPLMAMLRGLRTANHADPNVIFLHSERFLEHVPYVSELKRRSRTDPNLRFALFLTGKGEGEAESEKGWQQDTQGKVGVQRGRMDGKALLEAVPDLLGKKGEQSPRGVYICGPSAYIEGMKDLLVDLGLPGEAIHTEHFYF